jgi:O-antigen/teichoic acid export membrane protein
MGIPSHASASIRRRMDEATVVPAAPPRLRTDVLWTFGGKAATLVCGLLIVVVIARELGPSGQGLFAVAYTLTLLLAQLGGLGLTTANPYFTAREPQRRKPIAANSLWLALTLGLLLIAVGAALKALDLDALAGLGWEPLLVALLGVPAALAALFLQSVLLGESRMVAYNVVEAALAVLTLVALVVVFAAGDAGLTAALAVLTAGRYAAVLTYVALLRPAGWFDAGLAARMLAYGLRAYVAIVVSFLVIRLDLLLVNGYLGSVEAGLYSVAATIADGMFVLPMVVALNLFPRVARSGSHEQTAEVFRSIAVLYGALCLLTIPAAQAIPFVFGEEFEGSISLYYWLLPGVFALGLLTILAHHFAGRGYPREAAAIWFVGLALNIAINVAFLPGRGAWVASLASSVAYAVLLALHVRLFVREAGTWAVLRPRADEIVRLVRGR